MTARPLEGIRVVDFTWVRAGPWATRWLAVLGAEVIKVEWPDPALGPFTGRTVRIIPGQGTTPEGVTPNMNSDGMTSDQNAGKKSITINTRTEKGLETVKQLVSVSDIVIENFSAGVLKSWGLDYEEMARLQPGIIYVSMAGFGHAGPQGHYTTMGPSVQALSGLTFLSGYPGRPPAGWGWSYMDDTGGMYAVISVLSALHHRDHTGEGQHVDMSQVAAGITLTGPAHLDLVVNGRGSRRPGFPPANRSVWPGAPVLHNYRGPIQAPHNSYRTLGGDYNDWCVIACRDNADWRALAEVIGEDWAQDERYSTLNGRLEHQEELDQRIQEWTVKLDKYDVMEVCARAGVPAAPVQGPDDRLDRDPQLKARDHYVPHTHPVIGTFPLQSAPWHYEKTPTPVPAPGPLCGVDNVEVLVGMLGLDPEELRAGYEDGTFWPQSVPVEPYLIEALEQAPSGATVGR